jgi:hypothetical protein
MTNLRGKVRWVIPRKPTRQSPTNRWPQIAPCHARTRSYAPEHHTDRSGSALCWQIRKGGLAFRRERVGLTLTYQGSFCSWLGAIPHLGPVVLLGRRRTEGKMNMTKQEGLYNTLRGRFR